MNVRYFETTTGLWWFGGGIDLTPHFVSASLATAFHKKLKAVCDEHNSDYYAKFKKWADDYFYVKHRKETRGIGGIFFDRLGKDKGSKEEVFAFVYDVGNLFNDIYTEQFNNQFEKPFTSAEKNWQLHRRGRYVEFNLVYDKGTKFGLDTDGRIESILMSLPPQANWVYDFQTKEGSPEAETLKSLKKEVDWLNIL